MNSDSNNMDFQSSEIKKLIQAALTEDIGEGDHTSLASITEGTRGSATLLFKEKGIVAGLELGKQIFLTCDPNAKVSIFLNEGDAVEVGMTGMEVEGDARAILSAERLVLNFMQRLSGVATATHNMNERIKGTKSRLLDTRKTTPLLRSLEKWAVTIGGGLNHRIGLYDMILLKDNHVDFAGGISAAIENTQAYLRHTGLSLKVEIETRNLAEVKEVLACGGVDRIMLDNFSPAEMKEAVTLIGGAYETEASGGITLDSIREYAETGVDFISSGALTHSVKSLDISLKVKIGG